MGIRYMTLDDRGLLEGRCPGLTPWAFAIWPWITGGSLRGGAPVFRQDWNSYGTRLHAASNKIEAAICTRLKEVFHIVGHCSSGDATNFQGSLFMATAEVNPYRYGGFARPSRIKGQPFSRFSFRPAIDGHSPPMGASPTLFMRMCVSQCFSHIVTLSGCP